MVASSSATPPSEKDLEEEVIDYGVRLFTPPSSNDELLSFLDKVESLLVRVGQAPSETMRNALHPIMKALIGSELLGHSEEAVKVSVVLCLSEIMRITAPRQPYDDAVMKEIFQHIVETLEKLSNVKSHCYSKVAQILDNVSKVRACVMLLDLECDTIVVGIIKLFLRIISSSHGNDVFTNMEDIIIWIIKECDEVSGELLMPLVDSIKNENQTVSPVSWQLGQNVLEKCSSVVRPYVVEAVKSKNLDINGYAGILSSIYHEVPEGEDKMGNENGPLAACPVEVESSAQVPPVLQQDDTPTSIDISNKNQESENSSKTSQHCQHLKDTGPEHHSLEDRQPGSNTSGLPKKRGRKPQRKPDADSKESPLLPEDEKSTATAMLSPESAGTVHPVSTPSKGNKDGSTRKRGRPKKNQLDLSSKKGSEGPTTKAKRRRGPGKNEPSVEYNAEKSPGSNVVIKTEDEILSEDNSLSLHQNENLSKKSAKANKENAGNREDTEKIAVIKASHGEELVGAKIRVWWPMDQKFYEGEVSSFDPVKKKHKVVYADGDVENLNLAKQRWKMINEIPSNEDHEADPPVSPAMDGRKKRKGDSSRKQKPDISATKRSRRKVQGGATAKSPKPDDFWVADEVNDHAATQGEQPGNNENTPPPKEETEAPVEPSETVNPGESPSTAVA